MKPYYQRDGITIYHGDCRDVLPQLEAERIELVLTDPPYGISYSPGPGGDGWATKTYAGSDLVAGDNQPFDPSPLLHFKRLILWGGNHYAHRLPPSPSWLIWYKRFPGEPGNDFADCEIAWSNLGGVARVYAHEWKGAMRASERARHYHPTQKPVALMRWCLGLAAGARTVLDPFMGAGPVARACRDMGRQYIGVEIEERYCEIAAKRLSQEVLPLELPS